MLLWFKRNRIRKYLWARESRVDARPVFVQVEAHNKDESLDILVKSFPYVARDDWEFQEELDAEHELGALGITIRWNPNVTLH